MLSKIISCLLALSVIVLPGCWQEKQEAIQENQKPSKSVHLQDIVENKQDAPEVLRNYVAQGNVVVDFYAKWCPPCKMMLPIIDELSNKYENISFIKVDIDKFMDLANGFDVAGKHIAIQGVPVFYFFKDGTIVDKIDGGMNKEAFEQIMNTSFGQ